MPPAHYAAGVLFVTFVERGTRPLFLVGKELRCSLWSDWAGKAERSDRNCAIATAAREAWEESYGQLMSVPAMTARLQQGRCIRLLSRTQNGNLFHCFVLEIAFAPDFVTAFRRSLEFLRARCPGSGSGSARSLVEKTDARWVTMAELFSDEALPKRSVFASTVQQHRRVLESLTDVHAWREATAVNAQDDAWRVV